MWVHLFVRSLVERIGAVGEVSSGVWGMAA